MIHGATPPTETSFASSAKVHTISPQSTLGAKPSTLVVCCHGLSGSHDDYNRLVITFSEAVAGQTTNTNTNTTTTTTTNNNNNTFLFVLPTTNEGWPINHPTHQGTLPCATRAYTAVTEVLREHPDATELQNIIVVGHSFGGIYSRAMIKMFVEDGTIPDKLKPLGYLSIASPHLGIRRRPSAFTSIFQFVAPIVGGTTGTELLLDDEDDVIVNISQGKYLDALRMFRSRTCYGNVYNDLQVPLCTSTLRDRNPYRNGTIGDINPVYPSIVTLATRIDQVDAVDTIDKLSPSSDSTAAAAAAAAAATTSFSSNTLGEKIRLIHSNLVQLGWQRFDCLHTGIDPHNQILGNGIAGWTLSGKDIRHHIVATLLNIDRMGWSENK